VATDGFSSNDRRNRDPVEAGAMTLKFRVTIQNVVHEVRVDVLPGHQETDWPDIEEFVLRTAWLEHLGRLPQGVLNAQA
jgi:hypothetical protein